MKAVAVTSSAAVISAGLGVAPTVLTSQSAQATSSSGRNKLIFVSDIHMNVDAPYSWFSSHAKYLAAFLESINNRTDVAELIIIGDLLDDWVSPVESASSNFSAILAASTNQSSIQALQAICNNPNIKVTYLTGNHDLLSFELQNKATIQATFPNMSIISDSPGLGAYSKDNVIWAEHGHRYTLFNAPDTWSRSGGYLPLGYFISRLAASASIKNNRIITTPELLDEFIKKPTSELNGLLEKQGRHTKHLSELNGLLEKQGWHTKHLKSKADKGTFDDAFILLVYSAIAAYSGYLPWNTYAMNGLDGFTTNPSVIQIGATYDHILSGWDSRQDIVGSLNAILDDIGSLGSAANLLFEMPTYIKSKYPFTPRIILFGHTHEAVFQYQSSSWDTIYINTGTWIDSKELMTWAEIECVYGQSGNDVYTASLWAYGENSPRFSGSIQIPI